MLRFTWLHKHSHSSTRPQKLFPSRPSPNTCWRNQRTNWTTPKKREGMGSKQTAFVTLAEEKPSYGFFPCANSISEMPSDQMSLFNSVSSSNTSGALYHRVPHWLFSLEQECSIRSAKPKSPSLIKPFAEMNRLSGLMSYPFIPTYSALRDEWSSIHEDNAVRISSSLQSRAIPPQLSRFHCVWMYRGICSDRAPWQPDWLVLWGESLPRAHLRYKSLPCIAQWIVRCISVVVHSQIGSFLHSRIDSFSWLPHTHWLPYPTPWIPHQMRYVLWDCITRHPSPIFSLIM